MCQLNSLMFLLINSEKYITGAWLEVPVHFIWIPPQAGKLPLVIFYMPVLIEV